MKHKYESRACEVCGDEYTPTRNDQRACGQTCGRTLAGRTLAARGTPAAFKSRQQENVAIRRRRIERSCAEKFGQLTSRELDICAFGQAEGYGRGYSKGYSASSRPGIARCSKCLHVKDGVGGMCSKEWCRCVCAPARKMGAA